MNLEGLKLTSGEITEIPDSEFNACTGLEQITFPETLKKSEKNAFSGCTSLKKSFQLERLLLWGSSCRMSVRSERLLLAAVPV